MKRLSCSDAGCLYLMAISSFIAVLIMLAIVNYSYAAKPAGAPPSTQAETAWFQQAFIPGIGGCCSEADGFREGIAYPEMLGTMSFNGSGGHPHPSGVILQDWKGTPDKAGEYDIKVLGQWIHVEAKSVLPNKPANPTGGAVAFIVFNYKYGGGDKGEYAIFLRCFSPGNLG